MGEKQAIDILIQTAKLAQKGGILSLEDAVVILEAIKTVQPLLVEAPAEAPAGKAKELPKK